MVILRTAFYYNFLCKNIHSHGTYWTTLVLWTLDSVFTRLHRKRIWYSLRLTATVQRISSMTYISHMHVHAVLSRTAKSWQRRLYLQFSQICLQAYWIKVTDTGWQFTQAWSISLCQSYFRWNCQKCLECVILSPEIVLLYPKMLYRFRGHKF